MRPSGTTWIRDRGAGAVVLLVVGAMGLVHCDDERELPDSDASVHVAGYEDPDAKTFHGTKLREALYPMDDCRGCHGQDFAGTAAAPSCNTAGCHERGVEACDTCHGFEQGPLPRSGAHLTHDVSCETCHRVPDDAFTPAHPDGDARVQLTGFARHDASSPTWNATSQTCSDVYCHGGRDAIWESGAGPLDCDACHDAPPSWHVQFSTSTSDCVTCHDAGDDHIDGELDTLPLACDTCHGAGALGAPPAGLDGSTESSSPSVGAHARHLDATLSDRIGAVAECGDCHEVPTSLETAGHIDDSAPADVRLWGGLYDPNTQRCVTGCHYDRSPGPAWTDDSGAARDCGACHEAAPTKKADGSAHAVVLPDPAACLLCHDFAPETHVDGLINMAVTP